MQSDGPDAVYKVLSSDNLIYGPINLATLVQWVQERRVQRETWVHWETANDWVAAGQITDLESAFNTLTDLTSEPAPAQVHPQVVTVDELRRFERFAPYANEDLAVLLQYCEVVPAAQGDVIIRKGDLSDSMYLVVSGNVRARIRVGGRDTWLGAIEPGEVFGEVAMLSQTARSADVVADAPTRLLRLTSERFQELMQEHSRLAARLLFNISRQLATRLGQRNDELQKDLASSYVWR
jgi:hypothetical protein